MEIGDKGYLIEVGMRGLREDKWLKSPQHRLRELREARKLTQQEVAKLLDIDHTTVSRHESGSRGLSPEDIQKYARLYKVESYELFIDPRDLQEQEDESEDEAESGATTTGE